MQKIHNNTTHHLLGTAAAAAAVAATGAAPVGAARTTTNSHLVGVSPFPHFRGVRGTSLGGVEATASTHAHAHHT